MDCHTDCEHANTADSVVVLNDGSGPVGITLSPQLQLKKVAPESQADRAGAGRFLKRKVQSINGAVPKSKTEAEKMLRVPGELRVAFKCGKLGVAVLCGFLGAGKTTLLNHLLSQKHGRHIAVVVNDLSVVNVDSEQVVRKTEQVVELQNGCICCTLRGDLVESLFDLARQGTFDYAIVESTGIGESMPIAQTFDSGVCEKTGEKLSDAARLDAMVTVVDVSAFGGFFCKGTAVSEVSEWEKPTDARSVSALLADQVSCASTVIMNKMDLATEAQQKLAQEIVKTLNPTATQLPATKSNVAWDAIIDSHQWDQSQYEGTQAWIEEQNAIHVPETEEYGISSFAWVKDGKDSRPFGDHCLFALLHGELPLEGVVRAKGWVYSEADVDQRLLWSISGGGRTLDLVPESRWRVAEEADLEGLGDGIPQGGQNYLADVRAAISKIKERGAWSETYGDRRQEIVFIGRREDGFDPDAIRSAMDKLLDSEPSPVGELSVASSVGGRDIFDHPALVARVEGCSKEVQQAVTRRLEELAREHPDTLFFTSKRVESVPAWITDPAALESPCAKFSTHPSWLAAATSHHAACAEKACATPVWVVTRFHEGTSFCAAKEKFGADVPLRVVEKAASGELKAHAADWNRQAKQDLEDQLGGDDKKPEQVTTLQTTHPVADLSIFAPFVNLEALRIGCPPVAGVRLTSLAALPPFSKLAELHVPDHQLTDLPDDFAKRYPNLEQLIVPGNGFATLASLQPLSACRNLVLLDHEGNPVAKKPTAKRTADYRAKLFARIKSLQVLDGKDVDGNDVDVDGEEDEEMEECEEEEEEEAEEVCDEEELNPPTSRSTPAKRKRDDDSQSQSRTDAMRRRM